MKTLFILVLLSSPKQIDSLDCYLTEPFYNTDRKDGYGFEVRGKVYRTGTTEQVASYLLRVRKNALDERLATWRITLTDGRQIVWDAATHYEQDDNGNALSFAYTAGILRSDSRVLTDFEPFYYYGYGGKLKLFFLE